MGIDTSVVAILITLIIAVIGVSFGYGILTNRVSSHQRDIEKLQKSYDLIDAKLDLVISKIVTIETVLRIQAQNRES